MPSADSGASTRRPKSRPGPEKISVARLPITGSEVFGREEDIIFLDDAWVNREVNVARHPRLFGGLGCCRHCEVMAKGQRPF